MESNVYDNNTGFEVCLLKKNLSIWRTKYFFFFK